MNRIELTSDLSPTLYSEEFEQTYHSHHGAISESMHVFIQNGLEKWLFSGKKKLRIFEMGFGTGLNAALTWQYALKYDLEIEYETIELFPVNANLICDFKTLDEDLNQKIQILHKIDWEKQFDFRQFQFTKKRVSLIDYASDILFDLIYFDAFSPNAQPELWTESIFEKMYQLLNPNGILTTYCAKGEVKRNLKKVGFEVQSPPGAMGKREMTVAVKNITNLS